MTTSSLVLVTLLILPACAHAPPEPAPAAPAAAHKVETDRLEAASGVLFAGCGFLVIENHGATNFTVLLRAEHAEQLEKNGTAWVLDNVVVETTSTTAREMGAPELRNRPLLLKHLEWETRYLGDRAGWRGLARPEIGNLSLGVPFPTLAWIATPTGNVEVAGQSIKGLLYVSAAIDDVVFVLAAPLRSPSDLEAAGPVLQRILKTLHQTPEPTDLVAVSARMKESPAPWPGCATAE
jgi:hypothetical protein